MHHERAAVAIEERRGAGTERDAVGGGLQPATPVGLDRDIRQIAGVRAPRVEQAVLPSVGVEVVAGRIERRRFAAPHLVNVHGLCARRQASDLDDHPDPGVDLGQERGADRAPFGVVKLGRRGGADRPSRWQDGAPGDSHDHGH